MMQLRLWSLFTLLSTLAFAEVIESVTPNWFASQLKARVDTPERLEFRIDTPATTPFLRITPQKFVIKAGARYWVEPTATRPFEVTAKRDGVLELRFPRVPYQWIGILPSTGNLLPPLDGMTTVESPLGWARTNGLGGMLFHKTPQRGLFTVLIANDISLTPGKRYRLTYGYRFLKTNEGCFFYIRLTAKGPQGESVTNRDFRTPCVSDEPWLDGYCFLTVPAEWSSATLNVTANSEGTECDVELTGIDVREAIAPMRNHPRHHGTAQQYPPVTTTEAAVKILADSPIFEAKIARQSERPVLEINGSAVPITAYNGSYGPTVRMFQELGYPFNFCHIPMAAGYRYRTLPARPFWQGKDKYDYSVIDETLAKFYSYAPGQPIMLQVSLYPYLGYTEEFPEARWLEHDGKPLEIEAQKGHYFHSITGKTYRREVGKTIRKLGEYLKNSPWGRRIIGIHISDGGDGQWFDWSHSDWQHFHFDYSPDSQEELRMHIRRLYNNDIGRLRQAWNLPNAEFDTLELPKPDEWQSFFDTLLDKNDGKQRRLMDFASIQEDALVSSIDWCHKEFEEGLGRQVIGLVYFPHDSTSVLIRSPHIDGIVSVPFYGGHRAPGNANFIEQPAGSFRINDKICLTEMDHRTDFSELGCRVGGFDRRGLGNATGERLVNAQIRRDFAMTLTQGEYAWICTIAGYNTWSENYHAILGEYLRTAQATLQRPQKSDWGKIAFIQDLKAKRSSGRPYGFGFNTDRFPRKNIMTSGVGFSDYLVEDIGNPRLENGRIYIFANNINMTAQQIEYVTRNLQKNGNILVFTFATTLNTEGGFERNIQTLTGMRVRKNLGKSVLFQYAERQSDDPLAKGLCFVPVERGDKIPLFWVDDAEATPLAWHESDPNLVAAAAKRHSNWTAVYLANGYFGREFPRALVQEAGLTPDGPIGDVTLAGNSMRVLHAATGGVKELRWEGKANLIDLQTGQLVGYGTDCYRFMARPGDTRWFKIVK